MQCALQPPNCTQLTRAGLAALIIQVGCGWVSILEQIHTVDQKHVVVWG